MTIICQHCGPMTIREFETWEEFGDHVDYVHPGQTHVSVRIVRQSPVERPGHLAAS